MKYVTVCLLACFCLTGCGRWVSSPNDVTMFLAEQRTMEKAIQTWAEPEKIRAKAKIQRMKYDFGSKCKVKQESRQESVDEKLLSFKYE